MKKHHKHRPLPAIAETAAQVYDDVASDLGVTDMSDSAFIDYIGDYLCDKYPLNEVNEFLKTLKR